MSTEAPLQPIPVEKVGIPIPADQVTPEMRMNAIGSPERVGAGVLRDLEQASFAEVQGSPAEILGDAATADQVEVHEASLGTPPKADQNNPYDELLVGGGDSVSEQELIESAAVRPDTTLPAGSTSLRPGYWKPATAGQIAEGSKHGLDLAAHNAKYYPYSSAEK